MKDINRKYYEKFSAEERVQLTISALSRQDSQEADKLRNTCPRISYTMKDLQYMNRMQAIEKMTMALAAICTELLDKIRIQKLALSGAQLAMHASSKGFQLGYRIGQSKKSKKPLKYEYNPFEDIDNLYDEISNDHDSLQENIIQLKAAYQAFNEICAEENINADQLIKWFGIFEHLKELKNYLGCPVTATNEALKMYMEVFKKQLS